MKVCEAFRVIVTAGVEEVLFDCFSKEIVIITCTGEEYRFIVKEVKGDEE